MTRTIDWVGEARQALTRKQNHVNLTADDLLAWEALPHILNRVTALTALAVELLDAYVDACWQGTGEEPCSKPGWHMFMSTYEYANELIPRARAALLEGP